MSAFCYDIRYDFMEDNDVLPDWQEHLCSTSRPTTPPKSGVAEYIYDGMAGLFIAESMEDFALEYAAVANFILDNTEAATFLIKNEPICNALHKFTVQMRKEFPAALQLVDAMEAQLDSIRAEHGK